MLYRLNTHNNAPNLLDGLPRGGSHRRSLEGQLFLEILAATNHFTIRAVALL